MGKKDKKRDRKRKPESGFGGFEAFAAAQGITIDKKKQTAKKNPIVTRGGKNLHINHYSPIREYRKANAPYNFVPVHNKKVQADTKPGQDLAFDRYHKDKNTGYLDLEITTETPIYIRDTLDYMQQKEKARLEKKEDRNFINSDFFSPGGELQIPGSSLRGMTRTAIEILSFGKFGFSDHEKYLFFRGLADISNRVRKMYQDKMSSFEGGKSVYQMSAGILSKKGRKYYITESSFEYILRTKAKDEVRSLGERYQQFAFYKTDRGYIVVSGAKIKDAEKPKDWLVHIPKKNAEKIEISEKVIHSYQNDINRDERGDLLKHFEKNPQINVPCFYVLDKNDEISSFGHTAMFRISYDKNIGDHVPEEIHELSEYIDIPEAIFGSNEMKFSSRVFFENAKVVLKSDQLQSSAYMEEGIPKVLSSPKPTTFQHYLVQKTDDVNELCNYNDDTSVRGNKLYWHKSGNSWQENEISYDAQKFEQLLNDHNESEEKFRAGLSRDNNKVRVDLNKYSKDVLPSIKKLVLKSVGKHETQHTKIKTIKPKTTFRGRIRFENLSDVELGALIFALDLPKGCSHKIGMGKPLGLGSITTKPRLFLSDRIQRYSSLFCEWQNGMANQDGKEEFLKKAFENYIKSQLKSKKNSLWEESRLKEYKKLLDRSIGVNLDQQQKTNYMELGDFKKRKVLPKPSDI